MATRLDDGSWEIQGHRVTFPVRIRDAGVGLSTHVVPTRQVRGVLAAARTHLKPFSLLGRTPVFVMFVVYRDNDLGTYDEVGVAVPVRHTGPAGSRWGVHVLQLPVTETFTMEAGRALWGLPKWLARADLDIAGGRVDCRLDDGGDGGRVLDAALRTLPLPALPLTVPASLTALAPRGDVVLAAPVRMRARGTRVGAGGRVVPGTGHPMARQLRAMGFPRRALLTTVVDHVAFDMDPARELPTG
ncbi:acetoacetate decarboxylase family protein [Pseudonocardia sp. KRD291]|uniref:acetoacetate decarboxylase family protein n=1 Tax=Pseudonocardia sp. KRD291 TaxID=2792007 RepID=UPI001C4A3F42|nr:acetoacetate decarboxylase family protein [Pseudonocardia sp. KRD291]MBW0104127.1 acetoacetate decarboxylase family protein [Pseudonocardia sp. KRD291]